MQAQAGGGSASQPRGASPCLIQYPGWTHSLEFGILNPRHLTLQRSTVTSRQQAISLHLSDFFKVCKVQMQQQEGLQGTSARTTTQDTVNWGNSTGQAKSSLSWKKSLRWIHGRNVHQGLSGKKAWPLVSHVVNQWKLGQCTVASQPHTLFPWPWLLAAAGNYRWDQTDLPLTQYLLSLLSISVGWGWAYFHHNATERATLHNKLQEPSPS